ncbi:hypothetical protein TNCV_2071421 [Trichonephila clavipes]|uniref:Uncharacterized protein n=1 Tax=Trichonephila clavipes TaxID=2585209 RepID=A0A8X6W3S8_TRICX|nr:hypothetical protein TNCV_2071421 [Trichonephila clavipes]
MEGGRRFCTIWNHSEKHSVPGFPAGLRTSRWLSGGIGKNPDDEGTVVMNGLRFYLCSAVFINVILSLNHLFQF